MPLIVQHEANTLSIDKDVISRGRWRASNVAAAVYQLVKPTASKSDVALARMYDQSRRPHVFGCCSERIASHATIFKYCNEEKANDFVFECCMHFNFRTSWRIPQPSVVNDVVCGRQLDWNRDQPYARHEHQLYLDFPKRNSQRVFMIEVQLAHIDGCLKSREPKMIVQGRDGIFKSLYFKHCDGQYRNALGGCINEQRQRRRRRYRMTNDWIDWINEDELTRLFCPLAVPAPFWIHENQWALIHEENYASYPDECPECGTDHASTVVYETWLGPWERA